MSKRRNLDDTEHTFCIVAFRNIQPRFLSPKEGYLLASMASQYDWDGKLSEKQLKALKGLKHKSDHGIRREAIAQGKLDPDYYKKLNREEYLNSRHNPVGKSNIRTIYKRNGR